MDEPAVNRITIVTPSYNQGAFLEETLRSVISQRKLIHEYFVIDGGSTDDSVAIIQKYADGIDYWVSEKDSGQSEAIQKGFARASGDYLYWLNSDDVLLPGALEKVHAALERHPDWDALTGFMIRMDEASRVQSVHRIPAENPAAAQWGTLHVVQQTCFFKRAAYERVGGIDPKLHCVLDTDLWCRMFDAGTKWGHIPSYLAGFRQHGSAKGSASQWLQMYRQEEAMLRVRYPQYCADNLKHRVGQLCYRAGRALWGGYLQAWWDTRKFRGKTLAEVFGEVPNVAGR